MSNPDVRRATGFVLRTIPKNPLATSRWLMADGDFGPREKALVFESLADAAEKANRWEELLDTVATVIVEPAEQSA